MTGAGMDDRALLEAADTAAGRPPIEAALALLGVGDGDVAELDIRLLDLHVRRFGKRLEGVTTCPACEEMLEVTLDADALRPRASRELSIAAGAWEVEFRLPRASDLAAIAGVEDAVAARAQLAARCVLRVRPSAPDELPEEVVAAMAERMAEADPLGGSRLALDCPACGAHSAPAADLAWFLQREFAEEAARVVTEVHALASAYGWTQREILNLPRTRRARYLELVEA